MSLKNQTVFITGASSGIGKASAIAFANESCDLLLCARRMDRLEELKTELHSKNHDIDIHVFELDVRDQKAVHMSLSLLPENWRMIDILVNNAGLSRGLDKLHEGNLQDWEEMLDTNVKGLLYITREIVPGMIIRGKGHIINIGSIAGHEVYPKGNVYCASKFAVDAITKGLRMDLVDTPLRVTTIDPGLVETEFSKVRFHGDEEKAAQVYKTIKALQAEDVADAIVWAASRPDHVQVAEIILFPTAQASAAVVHRSS
jgi:3-hydroxy acid dehydrogenase/malonic semialdehyde reductase